MLGCNYYAETCRDECTNRVLCMLLRFNIVAWSLWVVVSPSSAVGQPQLDAREALHLIEECADRICPSVSPNSTASDIEASGEVKAGLSALLQRLVDGQVNVAGKYRNKSSQGVLQKDLAAAIARTQDCRKDVFHELTRLLLDRKTSDGDRGTSPPGPAGSARPEGVPPPTEPTEPKRRHRPKNPGGCFPWVHIRDSSSSQVLYNVTVNIEGESVGETNSSGELCVARRSEFLNRRVRLTVNRHGYVSPPHRDLTITEDGQAQATIELDRIDTAPVPLENPGCFPLIHVTDRSTSSGVDGASVYINGRNVGSTSASGDLCVLRSDVVLNEEVQLKVRRDGYQESAPEDFVVDKNGRSKREVRLQPVQTNKHEQHTGVVHRIGLFRAGLVLVSAGAVGLGVFSWQAGRAMDAVRADCAAKCSQRELDTSANRSHLHAYDRWRSISVVVAGAGLTAILGAVLWRSDSDTHKSKRAQAQFMLVGPTAQLSMVF